MRSSEIEVLAVQRRRRFSADEKRRMVQETYQSGMTLSGVARAHGVSPSLLFRWRKLSGDGSLQAVAADESVVLASEYQEAQCQIRRAWRDRRGRGGDRAQRSSPADPEHCWAATHVPVSPSGGTTAAISAANERLPGR